MMKVIRIIVVEGPDDWVTLTLNKSYLQPGKDPREEGHLSPNHRLDEIFRGSEEEFWKIQPKLCVL